MVEACSTWNICVDGGGIPKETGGSSLVMETEQEHNTKNDRRQKDLADVKVQYLLVGVRGVAENGFLLIPCFTSSNGID